ncbi:MAG: type IV pilus assembly protein PilM [Firmicutes bacterium]|nr:type IV pilus assembly protein PilM [Bacillota bacterium]
MFRVGVGLDIGASAVKIVELEESRKIKLNRLGMIPLPSGVFSGGEIKDQLEISEAVRDLIRISGIQITQVVVALSSLSNMVKLIKIPLQNRADISDIVKKEAQKHLTEPLSEINLDYHVVGTDKDRRETEVLLIWAHQKVIRGYLHALQSAGLKPVAIDIQQCALIRSAGFESRKIYEYCGILDIGEESTNLIITKAGIPVFTRVIPLAGGKLTQMISSGLGLPLGAAEELKILYGDALYNQQQTVADEMELKVNSLVNQWLKELSLELQRSIEYFQLQQIGKPVIGRLAVSGGGSMIKNLIPYLIKEFSLEVCRYQTGEKYDVPLELKHQLEEALPMYNVALGLALREVTDDCE